MAPFWDEGCWKLAFKVRKVFFSFLILGENQARLIFSYSVICVYIRVWCVPKWSIIGIQKFFKGKRRHGETLPTPYFGLFGMWELKIINEMSDQSLKSAFLINLYLWLKVYIDELSVFIGFCWLIGFLMREYFFPLFLFTS